MIEIFDFIMFKGKHIQTYGINFKRIFNLKSAAGMLCILFIASYSHAQDSTRNTDTTKVLFIGNSYTFTNGMPIMFEKLAKAGGKNVKADYRAVNGYMLEKHAKDTVTLNKIKQPGWDYVVLQEHSVVPTIENLRQNRMYPSAKYLDSLVKAGGAQTVFYMTWGRKKGGQYTIESLKSPAFKSYFQMQDTLRKVYTELARELSDPLVPVGLAWERAIKKNPFVDLWNTDNSHPEVAGSYLTALMFYTELFGKNPVGLSYTAGLSKDLALFLQKVAFETYIASTAGK